MPTRILVAVVCLLAASLVAGCLGDQAPASDAPEDEPAGTPTPEPPEGFTLQACAEQLGAFTIPREHAEPYLPQGFEPVGPSGQPLPHGMVSVDVLGYSCQSPESGDDIEQLWVEILVQPPEELRGSGTSFYYVHVTGVTTNQTVHQAMVSWGVARMWSGEVTFEISQPAPGLEHQAREALLDEGALGLETTTNAEPVPVEGGSMRLFGVEEGELTGIVDIAYTEATVRAGQATLHDQGLLPFPVPSDGVGGYFTGMTHDYRPVPLPGSG